MFAPHVIKDVLTPSIHLGPNFHGYFLLSKKVLIESVHEIKTAASKYPLAFCERENRILPDPDAPK
jgi:hypothetical protein